MKIFTKKGITQKIILLIIIAILWNFAFPTFSRAGIGGILFEPVVDLITTVGDSILAILQSYLYNGKLNIKAGLGSIFMGAGYFKTVQDKNYENFEEMKFSDSSGEAVEIDSSEFDEIDVLSIAALIISPVAGVVAIAADALIDNNWLIPTVQYSVDKIFAGKVPAFDINFISPNDYSGDKEKQELSIAYQISQVISEWYAALRNLAIVILLCVLVYTGIRIVISSSADDKAKYKQRIMDWIVAMCLIFFMHYIMAFILSIIDILNDTIGDATTSIPVKISNGIKYNTTLMGLVRLQLQYKDLTPKLIYTIFYIALLVYTCKYTWIYLKRTVTMAFLTIIAPLVAMTYPIDKMNDGKAQAFNAWLKEYIFTALLQPFHLIIYTVLVGSAMGIAVKNPLYAIMVIAFIGPAEKMLRKFFGFDKASTPGMLSQAGAMFGGAAAWNMLKKGVGFIADKSGGGKSSSGGGNGVRTRGGNTVEDQNAPDGYNAFANSNDRNTEPMGDIASNNSNTQEPEEAGRAYLPPEEYESQTQDPSVWEYNDYFLNPQNYSGEHSNTEGMTNNTTNEQGQGTEENRKNSRKTPKALLTPMGVGAFRSIHNFASRKFANGRWKGTGLNALKKTAKFAGRVAAAGTIGAIGVGMGIAGDDLEDVLKYGAAGGILGYSVAPGVGRKIANSDLAQSIKAEIGKSMYGSVNAAEVVAQTNELYQSGELRDWAEETFLDKDGNKLTGQALNDLEDRAIGHYNDGFTDKGDIKKVMKLEDKMRKELVNNLPEQERSNAENVEQANEKARVMSETIGKIAKDITPGKLSDKKYVEGKLEEFEKGIKKANSDLSIDEVKANAKQMMNYIMQYYKKP